MHSRQADVADGDLLLWMDAGLSALQDVKQIFDLVEEHDFFITDHDDSPHWPLFNVSFTHPKCVEVVNPTNAELLAPHLCSAIVGYRVNGRFQHIIDQAWKFGKERDAVLWPKNRTDHLESGQPTHSLPSAVALRNGLIGRKVDPSSVSQNDLLNAFPYHGHRTQSILSILVSRHRAPSFSGKIYRQSNAASSEAARRNWQRTARETDAIASSRNLEGVTPDTVVYHHRGTYTKLDGLRFRRPANELFILGNGPSLRGFDFERLRDYDTLGMNAAYRYWDRANFYPTYYACFDTVVQESHRTEIYRLIREKQRNGINRFFLRGTIFEHYPELRDDPSVLVLEDLQQSCELFAQDKITTGSYSLLIGLFLGYRRLFLLGIDLNYVERLPESRPDGDSLEIASTPTSNPNYFFDDYQRQGDRYNPPNRHSDMHLRSWLQIGELVNSFPADVVNLNSDSAVRSFRFGSFDVLDAELREPYRKAWEVADCARQRVRERNHWREEFLRKIRASDVVLGPFDRSESAHCDETRAVASLLKSRGENGVMIDVGAHHGLAHAPFLDSGWTVYAFEPDDDNRSILLKRLSEHPSQHLVTLEHVCVSDDVRSGVPFYRSDESTGISGLSAFHSTHVKAKTVDTVSLAEYFRDHEMPDITFLKIDTEGHDLFVLHGYPWSRSRPLVIECEFEDSKTKPLGYTFHEIAEFIQRKGYVVYVSEWHPVVRYGIRHDWLALKRYPCELHDASAWGNLLAFREDPGQIALVSAFKQVLSSKARGSRAITGYPLGSTDGVQAKEKMKRRFYADFGDWVRLRFPRLFRNLQKIRRHITD
jgi:FkbM family methyltransferase